MYVQLIYNLSSFVASVESASLSYQQLASFARNFDDAFDVQPEVEDQHQLLSDARNDHLLEDDVSSDQSIRNDVIACVKRCRSRSDGVLSLRCSFDRCQKELMTSRAVGVTSDSPSDDSLMKAISKVMKRKLRLMKSGSDVSAPSERLRSDDDVVTSVDVTGGSAQQRDKRWTYMDPLKVCIAQKCEGRSEVQFYQCVYRRCLPKK